MGAGYLFTRLDGEHLKELFRSPAAVLFFLQLTLPLLLVVRGAYSVLSTSRHLLILLFLFFTPTFLFLAYEGSPANLMLPIYLPYILFLGAGASGRVRIGGLLLVLWAVTILVQSGDKAYAIHPEDWRSMSTIVRREASSSDAVFLTGSRNSIFTTNYYPVTPAERFSLVDSTKLLSSVDSHSVRSRLSVVKPVKALLRQYKRVWYLGSRLGSFQNIHPQWLCQNPSFAL